MPSIHPVGAVRIVVLVVALAAGCVPTATAPAPTLIAGPASSIPGTAGPTSPLRIVIDTDMAPDDVVAIASLLRDPAVEVLAISVVGTGEAHCPGGMFVARSLVTTLAERPIPVTCGRANPIADAEPFPDAWRAGADAASGLALAAPAFLPDGRSSEQLLVELAAAEHAAGRRLTILTLGTLTNLAEAAALDPSFASTARVVSMLGAVGVPGNASTTPGAGPTAEWNAHADPTAVRRVLEAGFDLTLVPLDATNDVPLTRDFYRALEADHAAGPADLVYELYTRNSFFLDGGFFLWDPLAAMAIRVPDVVTTRTARIRVLEGAGPDGGQLVEDPDGVSVTIADSADRAKFESLLLARLRLGAPRDGAFAPVGTVRVVTDGTTCDVTLDPARPPAGLLRVDLTSTATGPGFAIAFSLGQVPWSVVEAFAASSDFASPPPVQEFAGAFLEGPGAATAWGDATAGTIGIACAHGIVGAGQQPSAVVVRGPFTIGD